MGIDQSMAIRTAVTELLRGTTGAVRIVPAELFEPGVFDGQPAVAQQVKTQDLRFRHRFDLMIRTVGVHPASPMSNKGPYRIVRMRVEINLYTRLFNTTDAARREQQRMQIEGDHDTAIQALMYPGNLTVTLDAYPTGIVGGLLQGPDGASVPTWELLEEDWTKLILRSRIAGEAVVTQQQAVA